jgi:predicted transcriptional regulator
LLPFDTRRSSVQLISEILGLLRLGEVGKTEVMYAVKLTHSQTQRYLAKLVGLGLISQREDGRTPSYSITARGLNILGDIERLQEMLKVDEARSILDAPRLQQIDREQNRGLLKRIADAVQRRRDQI